MIVLKFDLSMAEDVLDQRLAKFEKLGLNLLRLQPRQEVIDWFSGSTEIWEKELPQPHLHERLLVSAWLAFSEKEQRGGLKDEDAWAYLKLLEWIKDLTEDEVLVGSEREDAPFLLKKEKIDKQIASIQSLRSWDQKARVALMNHARDNVLVLGKARVVNARVPGDLIRLEKIANGIGKNESVSVMLGPDSESGKEP